MPRDHEERSERRRRDRRRSRSRDEYGRDTSRERSRDRHRSRRSRERSSSRRRKSRSKERKRRKERRSRSSSSSRSRSRSRSKSPDMSMNMAPTVITRQREFTAYSNVDNPFNDANLEQQFVWNKKLQRDKKLGLSERELQRREMERREESRRELEKLRRRRQEREEEMRLREQEQMRLQRDADLALLGDWIAKEDEFHLEQAKKRAEIRIRDGRAKPIDILAMNLRLVNDEKNDDEEEEDIGVEVDLEEPYRIFDNLDLREMTELHSDIRYYLSLEKNEQNKKFWQSLLVVCDDELERLQAATRRKDEPMASRSSTAALVEADVQKLLSGKTLEQLDNLQTQIQRKLTSNEPIDVEYWEHVLRSLTVAKAKAKLDEIHQDMLTKRLERLREIQRRQAERSRMEIEKSLESHPEEGTSLQQARDEMEMEMDGADAAKPIEPYVRAMSPVLWDEIPRSDRDMVVVDAEEDMQALMNMREEVRKRKFVPKVLEQPQVQVEQPEEDLAAEMYRLEASRGLDEDEELFNIEETLAEKTYLWQDKYRPRRPRYFNRVHTGYEWNKYNQTHYDHDNPPPKVVQGYKFNIFYPDLIDKSKPPTYVIEEEPGNDETVILRFIAGPPYEDVAFRIVNRSWEYSHKKGFRSKFDRGVLQLHFRFKRHFYRR